MVVLNVTVLSIVRVIVACRCKTDPGLWIVDVGGLFGDFGLSTGMRGCRTIIFEPQQYRARDIAR